MFMLKEIQNLYGTASTTRPIITEKAATVGLQKKKTLPFLSRWPKNFT
jgi:hypothetical protein